MSNGGRLGARNVPGVDGFSGVWSLQEIANARRLGLWPPGVGTFGGLLRWYRADVLGLSDGAAVSSWTDQSTNADHAVQADSSKQPIYKVGVVNGHDAIRFDGSNDWLTFSEILDSSTAQAHIFIVSKSNATGAGGLLSTRPSSGSAGFVLRYSSPTDLGYFHTGYSPTVSYTLTDQVNVIEVQRHATAVTLGANGSLGTETVISGYSASSTNRTIIGAENDGNNNFLNGDIAEIVIYDHILTALQRDFVLSELSALYQP